MELSDSDDNTTLQQIDDNEDTPVPQLQLAHEHKLPLWRVLLLCALAGTVELGYAVESAYAAPLLVAAGLELKYASLILGVSPLFGILFHIYLGGLSDECRCKCGRRRPFILFLSITLILGFSIAPFSPRLNIGAVGILFTIIGILTLDFSLGQLQLPLRAYLLDVVPVSQVQSSNFILIVIGGIGGVLGFVLGGINWAKVLNQELNIITEAQVIFGLSIVLIIVCLLCTLFSVKEIPYRPQNDTEIQTTNNSCGCSLKNPKDCCFEFLKTILESLKFVYYMSKEMWILWFAVLFGFISSFSIILFFTTFVAEVVFGGIYDAPQDSEPYHLYTNGVQMGSWGLAIGQFFMVLTSLTLNWVSKQIGLKPVLLTVQYLTIVAYFTLTIFQNVPASLILGSFSGPFLGIYLTVPYALITLYQVSETIYE